MAADKGDREQILERVRVAVRNPAAKRAATSAGPIFPPVADPLERFKSECAANFMELVLTENPDQTASMLKQVLDSLPAGEAYLQDAPWLRELMAKSANGRPIRWSSEGAPAESSQGTVTLCEALVALTGSVLVSSKGSGGRGSSVVAPCHIVIARLAQLVPDLEAALARAREIAMDNSFVGLITGSSRTADIEKMLIIGAHGPRRLVVIVERG